MLKKPWLWGPVVTVTDAPSLAGMHLSATDREVLLQIGLPVRIEEMLMGFSHLPNGLPWLESVREDILAHGLPPQTYRMLGQGHYPNRDISIHVGTGNVVRALDDEKDPMRYQFVNASVTAYYGCLFALFQRTDGFSDVFTRKVIDGDLSPDKIVAQLERKFRRIDPVMMEDEESYWSYQLGEFHSY